MVQTHPASVHVAGALLKDKLKDRNGSHIKSGPLPPRGLALAYAMSGPLGEAHAPPIGPRAVSYTVSPPASLQDDQLQVQVPIQVQNLNDNQSSRQCSANVGVNEDSDDSGDDEF